MKPKILLVDDNEVIQILFKDIFWLHGIDSKFDLDIVSRADEAEKILIDPQKRPDIIFMGLVMPSEKEGRIKSSPEVGFNFLNKIKTTPECKNIKVIIFSSYAEKEYIDKAKQLGADMYLAKEKNLPQDLVQLLDDLYHSQVSTLTA